MTQNCRKARDKLDKAMDPETPDPWVLIDDAKGLLDKELEQ